MNGLFDITNTSDLPDELSNELRINTRDDFENKIISLFELAKELDIHELNIDQITTAYYRKYVKESLIPDNKTRKQIATKMSNISRGTNSVLISEKNKKGVYKLKNN